MASDKQIVDTYQSVLANTPEVVYTSPATGKGTLVTAVNASNATIADDRVYSLYIVSSAAAGTLPQVPGRTIASNKTDNPPEVSGQVIPPGGTLQFESNVAASISLTASGRDLT